MKIEFAESRENGYLEYYAIAKLQNWKGKLYEELLFAEITPGIRAVATTIPPKESFTPAMVDTVKLVWEDDYYNPQFFDTLKEAQDFVVKNWMKHTPHINGTEYEMV